MTVLTWFAQGGVNLPLPDLKSPWLFWGAAGAVVAYLAYIVVRRPKRRAGPEREL